MLDSRISCDSPAFLKQCRGLIVNTPDAHRATVFKSPSKPGFSRFRDLHQHTLCSFSLCLYIAISVCTTRLGRQNILPDPKPAISFSGVVSEKEI